MSQIMTSKHAQRGFSIVELMVGCVVGMLAILVIFNAFATFEGQKRSTTTTNDVQATGMLALQAIEREVRMAGYGMAVNILGATYMPCSTVNVYESGAATTVPLVPVSITDGGATGSDTITVMYATSALAATPAMLSGSISNSSNNVPVMNTALDPACASDSTKCAFQKKVGEEGDYLMIAQPTLAKACSRLRVTGMTGTSILHGTDPMNPPASTNIFPAGGYDDAATDPAVVINMGRMVRAQYAKAASSANLTYQNLTTGSTPVNIASGVVAIKAQYGIAASAGAQSVDRWISATDCTATGGTGWSTTRDPTHTSLCFPTAANVPLVKAIRVAVVVRSSLLEKDIVTGTCTNSAGVNNGPCAWNDAGDPNAADSPAPMIDLSGDPDWQRYRYRVFETIIPLRNVLWANI